MTAPSLSYRPGGWWAINPEGQPEMVQEDRQWNRQDIVNMSDVVLRQVFATLRERLDWVEVESCRRSPSGTAREAVREPVETADQVISRVNSFSAPAGMHMHRCILHLFDGVYGEVHLMGPATGPRAFAAVYTDACVMLCANLQDCREFNDHEIKHLFALSYSGEDGAHRYEEITVSSPESNPADPSLKRVLEV